jgi:hypothetical protein
MERVMVPSAPVVMLSTAPICCQAAALLLYAHIEKSAVVPEYPSKLMLMLTIFAAGWLMVFCIHRNAMSPVPWAGSAHRESSL